MKSNGLSSRRWLQGLGAAALLFALATPAWATITTCLALTGSPPAGTTCTLNSTFNITTDHDVAIADAPDLVIGASGALNYGATPGTLTVIGDLVVIGTITANGGTGQNGGTLTITVGGNADVNATSIIVAAGATGGAATAAGTGGTLTFTITGDLTVDGSITADGGTGGGSAGAPGNNGGAGGTLSITANTATVSGTVAANGAIGNQLGTGGAGGNVTIEADSVTVSGTVAANGANGRPGNTTNAGSAGGAGGVVQVTVTQDLDISGLSVTANGGAGGAGNNGTGSAINGTAGGPGGAAGAVTLDAGADGNIVITGAVSANAGNGGAGGAGQGQSGGSAGDGGAGGNGGNGGGAKGTNPKGVVIAAKSVDVGLTGVVSAAGGTGGSGGNGGARTGSGNGNAGDAGSAGNGGNAGPVTISPCCDTVTVAGTVSAKGGNGGNGGAGGGHGTGTGSAGDGGHAGNGGNGAAITIESDGAQTITGTLTAAKGLKGTAGAAGSGTGGVAGGAGTDGLDGSIHLTTSGAAINTGGASITPAAVEDDTASPFCGASFTVNKVYSPVGETTAVTISLSCDSGSASPPSASASPGSPAVFTVTGFTGDPNCTATESGVPAGYTGSDGGTCSAALVAGGSCTITNTQNSGSFTVNKVYSPVGETTAVTVSVSCDSGSASPPSASASPGSPAVFTVTGFTGDPNCTATESGVPAGYTGSDGGTCSAALVAGGSCTITNTQNSGSFTVNKVYSPVGETTAVTVSLSCASGSASPASASASPGSPAVFTVTGYTGDPNCTATESGVPAGYTGSDGGTCSAALVAGGSCTITNTQNSASFTVNKVYSPVGETTAVTMSVSCASGSVSPPSALASPGSPAVFTVTGYTGDPSCTATESGVPAGYTGSGNPAGTCSAALVAGGSCTITNTLNTVGDCTACDGLLDVDENVTVDLNPAVPTCDDGATADLCTYFSYDKSALDPAQWKAIFNVGGKRLVIHDNVTVTVAPVGAPGGNNLKSPGIVIAGTCELMVEGDSDGNGQSGAVIVKSTNQQAGDILISVNGNIRIDGLVRNEVVGTNGRPGEITIGSCCGDVVVGGPGPFGSVGRVESIGVGQGGNDINIATCCERGYTGAGGDIEIDGLVRAVHTYGATPTINIAAFVGAVTIDGRNNLGEEVVAGTTYRRMSGVYVQTINDTSAGDLNIQAENDVTVYGNYILNATRLQFGAVAVKAHNTNGLGGDGDIRVVSTAGGIQAIDRAFDFDGRFDGLNAITLSAMNDIALSVSPSFNAGALNNSKAVVSSQGGTGGMGGTNTLGSQTGKVIVNANAQVRANAPGGVDGTNVLAGCAAPGVIRNGTVVPIDVPGDDTSCPLVTPLFTDCGEFGLFDN